MLVTGIIKIGDRTYVTPGRHPLATTAMPSKPSGNEQPKELLYELSTSYSYEIKADFNPQQG